MSLTAGRVGMKKMRKEAKMGGTAETGRSANILLPCAVFFCFFCTLLLINRFIYVGCASYTGRSDYACQQGLVHLD